MDISATLEKALTCQDAGDLPRARVLLDDVLAKDPGHTDALYYRGLIDLAQTRPVEALNRFEAALDKAPDHGDAHAARGAALCVLGQYDEALAACDRAIALNPDDLQAQTTRGAVLGHLERHPEAIAACDRVLKYFPDSGEALAARGWSRAEQGELETALADLDAALALAPDLKFVRGQALYVAMRLCAWDDYEARRAEILRRINTGEAPTPPFRLLAIPSTARHHREAGAHYFRETVFIHGKRPAQARAPGGKIKLGYFSADFSTHAITHLIAGLFEQHDRSRFEVTAFALAGHALDVMRPAIRNAADRFEDVARNSDSEIVALACDLGIHIAIDLNIYIHRQPRIFARGVAPVQVNYLGYPGTSGADIYDYIIGDATITPLDRSADYSEHIAALPNAYQPNEFRRYGAIQTLSRKQLGLPEAGFVFCCLNDGYKIMPDVFDIWMRLLQSVPDSVLWLLEGSPAASANLRQEAQKRGVAPERLVFAPRAPLAIHFARLKAADLFLDTFPYNAHTTATDALWVGLPIVTRMGEAFPSRVAASLSTAAGVPDLITRDAYSYEALALALARAPERLAQVRAKLEAHRDTCALFNIARYTQNLEKAYQQMWQRYEEGLPPLGFQMGEKRIG